MNTSSGCLSRTATIISWLLILLFIVTLPPALVLRAGSALLFEPDFMAEVVREGLLDSGSLRQAVVRNLLGSVATSDDEILALLTADLTADEWQRISEIALPDAWLAEVTEQLTSSLIRWLDSEELVPELIVNVEPVKRRLIGAGSREIVEIIMASWPDCSLEEALAFQEAFQLGGELPFNPCQLPEPFSNVIAARIAEEFQNQVRSVPSTLDLMEANGEQNLDELLPVKSQLRQLRFFARWSLLVPFSFLGLLMALSVRSIWGLARWWGIPLFLGGAATLGLSLILAGALPGWLEGVSQAIDLPAVYAGVTQQVLLEAGDRVIWRTAIWGAVLGGMGGLLSLASLIFTKPSASTIPLSKNPGRR